MYWGFLMIGSWSFHISHCWFIGSVADRGLKIFILFQLDCSANKLEKSHFLHFQWVLHLSRAVEEVRCWFGMDPGCFSYQQLPMIYIEYILRWLGNDLKVTITLPTLVQSPITVIVVNLPFHWSTTTIRVRLCLLHFQIIRLQSKYLSISFSCIRMIYMK